MNKVNNNANCRAIIIKEVKTLSKNHSAYLKKKTPLKRARQTL